MPRPGRPSLRPRLFVTSALEAGDLADRTAERVFAGESPTTDEVQAFESANSTFAQATADGVVKLDELAHVYEQIGSGQISSAQSAGISAAKIVVADLIQYLKPRGMRYLYAGMSTVDCPMPWEDGYASCASGNLAPFYVAQEKVYEQRPLTITAHSDPAAIRRALLGEPDPDAPFTLVRRDYYGALKSKVTAQLPSVRASVEQLLCAQEAAAAAPVAE